MGLVPRYQPAHEADGPSGVMALLNAAGNLNGVHLRRSIGLAGPVSLTAMVGRLEWLRRISNMARLRSRALYLDLLIHIQNHVYHLGGKVGLEERNKTPARRGLAFRWARIWYARIFSHPFSLSLGLQAAVVPHRISGCTLLHPSACAWHQNPARL